MIDFYFELTNRLGELFGISPTLTNTIATILGVVTLVALLYRKLSDLIKKKIKIYSNTELYQYYSQSDIERVTKYYIPLKGYSEKNDPNKKNDYMIPLFIKNMSRHEDDKYFFVLADSGMGKTTFLINFYIEYKKYTGRLFSPLKNRISLLPMGYPELFEAIDKIEKKENTILLLDAFDEDIEAVKDYEKRLQTILKQVHHFRKIVISCRTQFFPSKAEEPAETGYFSFGEKGEYKFKKIYISIFDDENVKKYLQKIFSRVFQKKEYQKAKNIVLKSPTLIARPMLLSHIKDLTSSERLYEFSFQVYEELIKKWIERESKKPNIRGKFGSRDIFRENLYKFSKKFAIDLYKNKEKYGGYFLPKGETFSEGVINTSGGEKADLSLIVNIHKSRSLLNRDAIGNYKFSHKSIMEFFLAKECFSNPIFFNKFNFSGMDSAQNFFYEMLICKLRGLEGEFGVDKNGTNAQALKFLKLEELSSIKYLKIKNYSSIQPLVLKSFQNLSKLILIDHNFLHEIYLSYLLLFQLGRKSSYQLERKKKLHLIELKKWFELQEWIIVKKFDEQIVLDELIDRVEEINEIDTKKLSKSIFGFRQIAKRESRELRELIEDIDRIKLVEWVGLNKSFELEKLTKLRELIDLKAPPNDQERLIKRIEWIERLKQAKLITWGKLLVKIETINSYRLNKLLRQFNTSEIIEYIKMDHKENVKKKEELAEFREREEQKELKKIEKQNTLRIEGEKVRRKLNEMIEKTGKKTEEESSQMVVIDEQPLSRKEIRDYEEECRFSSLKRTLEDQKWKETYEKSKLIEQLKVVLPNHLGELIKRIEQVIQKDPLELIHLIELMELNKTFELDHNQKSLIKKLSKANQLLKEVSCLENQLKDCKIYY